MALFNVKINGAVVGVVDAPGKSQAKAWGKNQVDVSVEPATGDDINALISDGKSITKVEKKEVAAKTEKAAE